MHTFERLGEYARLPPRKFLASGIEGCVWDGQFRHLGQTLVLHLRRRADSFGSLTALAPTLPSFRWQRSMHTHVL